MAKQKKRFGDRRDGTLLRNIDAMHFIMPNIFPNRCDNEAFISERIDLTAINQWIAENNKTESRYPYRLFNVIVTAFLKTVMLRPKMNRFIQNCNIYQRNYLSAAFVVKKQFSDNGDEGLALIYAAEEDNIYSIHEKIRAVVQEVRSDKLDESSEAMDIFNKMPRFLSKSIIRFVRFLDRHGKVPKFLIATDPYYSSILLSNLGSIKLKSGYHHLANWGTNSLFVIVGEKAMTPVYDEAGNATMRETVELGLTVDERIADGYYYSKSVKLLKHLLENPELLEKPLNTKVDF
jgi:hypothetical protein